MSEVQISNLNKSYYGKQVLFDFNLNLKAGEVLGFFGPNGSGKTTVIKILANLLMNYEGEVFIDGKKPSVLTKKDVAYLPDIDFLDEKWTVKECLNVFQTFYDDFDRNHAEDLLKEFNIKKDAYVRTLSKGTKEKLQVILILARKAKLYIFDEPIAGVDPVGREIIFNLIKNNYHKEATVILTTHLISDIEDVTNRVVFISQGRKVLDMTKEEIKAKYGDISIDYLYRETFRNQGGMR